MFTKYDPQKASGDQQYGLCPLHTEKTPSFVVNEATGDWYCHGCGTGGGQVQFIQKLYDVPLKVSTDIVDQWDRRDIWIMPQEAVIDKYHKALLGSKYQTLLNTYGITDDIIKEFKLGLEDIRIVIPVRNSNGDIVNLRKYLPAEYRYGEKEPKCVNARFLGHVRYWPDNAFDDKEAPIFIVEGERDCLVARSQGLNAITSTGGSAIPHDQLLRFKDMDVVLMLDTDAVGLRTAGQYLKALKGIAKQLQMIKLPMKDLGDYYVECRNNGAKLDIWKYEINVASENDIRRSETSDGLDLSLVRSEFVENLDTWVKLEGMSVIGAEPRVYSIPQKLKCMCSNYKCTKPCTLAGNSGNNIIDVSPRDLVSFPDSSDALQSKIAAQHFGCRTVAVEGTDYINVQKIIFQERASFLEGLEESSFENRYGLYVYTDFRLQSTLTYDFDACRITDPKTQKAVYLIRGAAQTNLLETDAPMDDAPWEELQQVASKCSTGMEMIEYWNKKWLPLLGVEQRPDLFGVLMLTYLSVTEIPWRGSVMKGWLDCMIIGDTRTGKSQIVQRFVKAVRLGSYINGENARRTGVIGGLQRFGDSWMITWGAIPMNDKGMLIVDEASGLDVDDIKDLSSTRSSGAVTINKIVKGEARARTRLIWLSNPRSGRNLDEFFWRGFGAFQEFIPVAEDQARYDLVTSAAREDVGELQYTCDTSDSDLDLHQWRSLIATAWALTSEQITVDTTEVLEISRELGRAFDGGTLIVPVAIHEKILRIGAAFAMLAGSFDREACMLKVEKIHLEWASQFIKLCLNKESFGYSDYLAETNKASISRREHGAYMKALVVAHPALKALLAGRSFKGFQFKEVLGLGATDSAKVLSELLIKGLVRAGSGATYYPDKVLISLVKELNKT